MNFEQRKEAASKKVFAFLQAFSVPRGLPLSQQEARMTSIADAFARRMPTTGDYDEAIERVFAKIRDSHMSNSWPAQAVFVSYMPETERSMARAAETYAPDEIDTTANKMAAGLGVPERFVWGGASDALVAQSKVTRETMDRYRDASVRSFREAYGKEAMDTMVRRLGSAVVPYFNSHDRRAA